MVYLASPSGQRASMIPLVLAIVQPVYQQLLVTKLLTILFIASKLLYHSEDFVNYTCFF